jgi:DNA-binding NarL/FixJ family response regulator
MLDLSDIKITRRDEPVLHLLVEGCSNKEIAEQLNISPRTVKQHLRTLFLRAGIKDGRKRVLAISCRTPDRLLTLPSLQLRLRRVFRAR